MKRCPAIVVCGLQICSVGSQKILDNIKVTRPAGQVKRCHPSTRQRSVVHIRAILQGLLHPSQIPIFRRVEQLSTPRATSATSTHCCFFCGDDGGDDDDDNNNKDDGVLAIRFASSIRSSTDVAASRRLAPFALCRLRNPPLRSQNRASEGDATRNPVIRRAKIFRNLHSHLLDKNEPPQHSVVNQEINPSY